MRSAFIFIIILSVIFFTEIKSLLYSDRSSDGITQLTKLSPSQNDVNISERISVDVKIATLNQEVNNLKNKMDKLAQAFQSVQVSHQTLNTDSADFMTDLSLDYDEYIIAEQEKSGNQQTELEHLFTSEVTDLAWVNRMEPEFISSLNRLPDFGLKDTKMVYHECRATLCNAEFEHGKDENPQLLSTALAMPEVERISIVSALSDDGTPTSKVYFFREGFDNINIP